SSSFFLSSRRRHTRCYRDWSSDVCSSDLRLPLQRYCNQISSLLSRVQFLFVPSFFPTIDYTTSSLYLWPVLQRLSIPKRFGGPEIGRASCRERVWISVLCVCVE